MHPIRCHLLFPFLAVSVASQSPTVTVSAANPLVVLVSTATGGVQSTLPAGPLVSGGSLVASLPGPGFSWAGVSWQAAADDHQASFWLEATIDAATAPSTFAGHVGPNEFLLQCTASGPAPARLFASRQGNLVPGAPWPTVQVDFGNDGTIDIADLGFPGVNRFEPAFGVQPILVRIVIDASLLGPGRSQTWVSVDLLPENNVTLATVAIGCSASGWPLVLYPSFTDRAIDIFLWPGTTFLADPTVFVVGLSQQPLLLPAMPWAPCLLVPSPDILLVPPPGAADLHIPLPAVLRPVEFWVQSAAVTPIGLWTTDAVRVTAP